ncbi:hypothetical protein PUMCH_003012 [Australozyma saopauloensis]|uniref:Uncharacterized protein n=1 Tax=Australozyma saopauloensis TaxID=291208 RepID=A0AAX4HBD2_9ASCO|nr:hypothetical protein PUMCH_003012 [[Candida] saopauloensis]
MSLKLRHHLYYKFCVTARFQLSPAPTSVKEVQFIHDSFKKIAPVEFFLMEYSDHSPSNPWKQHATVVLNASNQLPQLNPFNEADETERPSLAFLQQRQLDIKQFLMLICALPRYLFIEHDDTYFLRQMCVPFKHTLSQDGKHLMGGYEVTDSTVDSPFVTLKTGHDPKLVVSRLRHNFQKFHKFKPVKVYNSLYRLHGAGGLQKEKLKIDIDADMDYDVASLMNLESNVKALLPFTKSSKFEGFFT